MREQKNDIEIFDSEEEAITLSLNHHELYDLKGNLITADDARSTLPDNTDLIQRVMDGDKKAFEMLYMQSYRYVFFVVRQFIPDDETTYDAIQEIFIKVYKNISNLREPDAFYGWITVIAKNTARDFLRTTRSETSLSYEEEDCSAFLKADETQKDVSLDIETVLKKLDPNDADLLSLVYYDGMRIAQIAKMQGVPATTVYSRLNRAKKNLKAQLNARGIDKAIYSGNFVSMVTVAIRNIIGTALLSVAIAQQILDSIINGKGKKELAVAKIIRTQQKKAILKIASVIVAISMATSAVTALTLIDLHGSKFSGDDNYLNSDTTEYYETESGDGENTPSDSSGSSSDNGGSNDTDSSNSVTNSSYYSDTSSINSDNSSQSGSSSQDSSSSKNSSVNTVTPTIPDDTTATDAVINTYGNNPNNVMRTLQPGLIAIGGSVAKQGDWIYYVQGATKLIKVKTDGSQAQVLFEVSGYESITSLNVIGDTIYYINGGIWSVKTDGTDNKQICSTAGFNLLVRDTTGWFVELSGLSDMAPTYLADNYNLYQIDLSTGKTTLLIEKGDGYGLKTVIDNSLIYVDGNTAYSRDLSTGSKKVLMEFDFKKGVYDMLVNGNKLYFSGGASENTVVEMDINTPSVISATYKFIRIYNYFNHSGGAFYAAFENGLNQNFYSLQGTALCEKNEEIYYNFGIYTLDDGYAYYYDSSFSALYRCKPDGSDLKVY